MRISKKGRETRTERKQKHFMCKICTPSMAAGANTAASLRRSIARLCKQQKGFSAGLSATFIDAKPHHKT
jgi:hypothetical protein